MGVHALDFSSKPKKQLYFSNSFFKKLFIMCGKILEWFASLLAAICLVATTAISVIVIFSNQWFTSSLAPDIGLQCNPDLVTSCSTNDWGMDWSALTTNDQKAIVGLLAAAVCAGAVALFFLAWALLCFCCLLSAGGLVAAFFAFLQFAALLSATLIFAAEWDWSVPADYSMGSAYIATIVAIPLSLLAAMLAALHHSRHGRGKDVV